MITDIKEIADLPQANTNQSLVKLVNILEKGMQDLEIIDVCRSCQCVHSKSTRKEVITKSVAKMFRKSLCIKLLKREN